MYCILWLFEGSTRYVRTIQLLSGLSYYVIKWSIQRVSVFSGTCTVRVSSMRLSGWSWHGLYRHALKWILVNCGPPLLSGRRRREVITHSLPSPSPLSFPLFLPPSFPSLPPFPLHSSFLLPSFPSPFTSLPFLHPLPPLPSISFPSSLFPHQLRLDL